MNTLTNMDFHTRLSSAGLIYVHYGHEVIANLLKIVNEPRSDPTISIIYTKLYKCFVESVDAIDNGESFVTLGRLVFITLLYRHHAIRRGSTVRNDGFLMELICLF